MNSSGEIAQQLPKYATFDFERIGISASPVKLNEPTTATALFETASRAHAAASVGVPFVSQKTTLTLWPLMPPWALVQSPHTRAVSAMFLYCGPWVLTSANV